MEYKYVRMENFDTYGVSRSMFTTKESYLQSKDGGIAQLLMAVGMTPTCELIPGTGTQGECGYRDGFFYPDSTTFRKLPWTDDTASVFGDYRIQPNDPSSPHFFASSRGILKKALEKLSAMGLKIFGAYEYEFYLFDEKTGEPALDGINMNATPLQVKFEPVLKEIMENLYKLGIKPEVHGLEYGIGQMELTYSPHYGIDIADNAARFKQCVREIASRHGYHASFMSRAHSSSTGSSAHLNHSLWNEKGENVFYDSEDNIHLSQLSRHWIGGLQRHADALACLAAATPNCFERFKSGFSPTVNAWGIDNRTCCYRFKNWNEKKTYLEYRLPGAATNQHLTLAALILAGIDGVENKIEPHHSPYAGDATKLVNNGSRKADGCYFLPTSLKEALVYFNNDEMFKKELGDEFCKCFNALRSYESEQFETAVKYNKAAEWQHKQYFKVF